MTARSTIKNGPSKWQIILALFEPRKMPLVSFCFAQDAEKKQMVQILCADRMDEGGDEWTLVCRYPAPRLRHFRMVYLTTTRKGVIVDSWREEPGAKLSSEELTQRVCDRPELLFRQLYREDLERDDASPPD